MNQIQSHEILAAARLEKSIVDVILGTDGLEDPEIFNPDVWRDGPYQLVVDGLRAVLNRDNLRFTVGSGYGNRSGIIPWVSIDSGDNYVEVELGLDELSRPRFAVLPNRNTGD